MAIVTDAGNLVHMYMQKFHIRQTASSRGRRLSACIQAVVTSQCRSPASQRVSTNKQHTITTTPPTLRASFHKLHSTFGRRLYMQRNHSADTGRWVCICTCDHGDDGHDPTCTSTVLPGRSLPLRPSPRVSGCCASLLMLCIITAPPSPLPLVFSPLLLLLCGAQCGTTPCRAMRWLARPSLLGMLLDLYTHMRMRMCVCAHVCAAHIPRCAARMPTRKPHRLSSDPLHHLSSAPLALLLPRQHTHLP